MTKNFSSPINHEVRSEDESTINSYKASVAKVLNPTLFYKKMHYVMPPVQKLFLNAKKLR